MEQNIILAGVGGQGILTIARAISSAAVRQGLKVKQAEVHGMSQRGGAVQSHLRVSDHELFSDLIPMGRADLVISVEPLETLRYAQYLSDGGVVVASSNAFVNIGNYPPVEGTLDRIAQFPSHVVLDVNGLARAAGSIRAANIVTLGAASLFVVMDAATLEEAVLEMFRAKGPKIVETNSRAFQFGRNAALAYREGLQRGGMPRAVRRWVETLSPEQLTAAKGPDTSTFEVLAAGDQLSGAEADAFEHVLVSVYDQGRRQLFEYEVYTLVELVGAAFPPRFVFVPRGGMITGEDLEQFPGDRVVLKIVSPDIVHKSDADGVVFVPKEYDTVEREIDRLVRGNSDAAQVAGVLLVELVEGTQPGFGNELFVGIRATREFGPVIAAGLGGIDTEDLAGKMKPGVAVAKAVATDISAEQFLDLFKSTAAYDTLSGRARGRSRIVSDGELLRCFRAFISIARRFCIDRGQTGPDVAELEVNPFAFRRQRMVPLDGRGRLATATKALPARPIEKVQHLLEPKSIAVLGVSGTSLNFGRIIVNNIRDCGFPRDHLYIVKENTKQIDDVPCVPDIASVPEPIDLLVIATSGPQMPGIVDQVISSGKVRSVVMIPGGMGETEGTRELLERVQRSIIAGHTRDDGGPVFLGPNCMGVQSRPGRYDTFFIPKNKLDTRWSAPPRRVALISQSGAFIITRMSNLETLDPALAISVGNQVDLTVCDLLEAVGRRDDVDAIGVYVEGFNNLDGLAFVQAVERVTAGGKVVVFYKAGRTDPGRSAAEGHTASIAGDYDICQTAAANAGAIVADTFKEFEQLIELATALHGKEVRGRRIAAVSNAGFETVGMADAIHGDRYEVFIPSMSEESKSRLAAVLERHKLAGLVNARNPLDLTPMAGEQAYEDCMRVMLDTDEFDALVVSVVPLTSALSTTHEELDKQPSSLAERLPDMFAQSNKPLIVVIDSGQSYDRLARQIRSRGVPVFRSSDQAIRSLGRYLCHRTHSQAASIAAASAPAAQPRLPYATEPQTSPPDESPPKPAQRGRTRSTGSNPRS